MNPFDELYKTDCDREQFGKDWVGPAELVFGIPAVAARYAKTCRDGYDSEIRVVALPARFYVVAAIPGANSVGEHRPGFSITTGGGVTVPFLIRLAKLVANGMIGVDSFTEAGS